MLLKSQKVWSQKNLPPKLSYYGAWLEWIDDTELREAMIAANINMIRREAAFAYFFANGQSTEPQVTPSELKNYRSLLTAKQLDHSLWLTYPEWEEPTTTTVTVIASGDVLPFVYFLDDDKYSLFCSPRSYSVEEIDDTIKLTNSNEGAMAALLTDGGCFISVIDHQNFKLQTLNDDFIKYFGKDQAHGLYP